MLEAALRFPSLASCSLSISIGPIALEKILVFLQKGHHESSTNLLPTGFWNLEFFEIFLPFLHVDRAVTRHKIQLCYLPPILSCRQLKA